jgi:predicted nucleic acid-binding protein
VSGFLLDTNVISELVRVRPDALVTSWVEETDEDLLYLSVLTLGEIRRGISLLRDGARRVRLEAWLAGDVVVRFQSRILPVSQPVADRWGRLSANASAAGLPLSVVDGLLAATALQHNLVLVTRNTKDVLPTGVPLFNPWVS